MSINTLAAKYIVYSRPVAFVGISHMVADYFIYKSGVDKNNSNRKIEALTYAPSNILFALSTTKMGIKFGFEYYTLFLDSVAAITGLISSFSDKTCKQDIHFRPWEFFSSCVSLVSTLALCRSLHLTMNKNSLLSKISKYTLLNSQNFLRRISSLGYGLSALACVLDGINEKDTHMQKSGYAAFLAALKLFITKAH